jgi:hypothetical protein
VCYCLYIAYALVRDFLFELVQSNICSRNIQKIERLVIQCIQIPQKIYRITKRLKTSENVEEYFPGFLDFIDVTEQQQQKYQDTPIIKERGYILFGKEEKRHTAIKRYRLWLITTRGLIIHKLG